MTTPADPPPDPTSGDGSGLPQPPPWGPPAGQPGYGPPPGYPPPGFGPPGYGPPPAYGPPGYGGQPGYGPPPGYAYYGAVPKTNTKAVIALILAISAYVPVVPFIGAVVALFLVPSARREIQASGGAETGLGLCTAAFVIALVHLVFIGLLVVLVLGLFALPFTIGAG